MSDDDPSVKDTVGDHPLRKFIHPDYYPGIFENVAQFIRRNFVLPFRVKERPVYYHKKFDRVPTIDQCEVEDVTCMYEANQQWLRDKKVDNAKLKIMRRRLTECYTYWGRTGPEKCKNEKEEWETNANHWFIKYGDLGRIDGALESYMKMKHRMIFIRRKRAEGMDCQFTDDREF